VRFAYADPPYIGQAKKHYSHDARCAEVDHRELLARLRDEYPDGWALSCSTPSLEEILHLSRDVIGPNAVRIGAWVKPFHVFKRGVRPAYAWEPIVFRGGRNKNHPPPPKGGKATTPKDWVSANITLRKGLVGAKPERVCAWLFDLLGAQLGDDLHDLYPGTGIVSACWQRWQDERAA
jgi:hypothetical protein